MKPVNVAKDFLTNCYVREGILPFLKKMEEEYLANKKPFTVLIMDVDHFKSFNDKYGHLMGDEVLKYFSSSMRLDLEDEENAPFRFGGDEFIMVFPNKNANDAYRLAGRLRKNIRTRSCLIKGKQIAVTFSGGIANYPSDANSIEDIIEKADKALYYSKNHGRSRITKYSELSRMELLQVLGVILLLALVGGGLYAFRDKLSSQVGNVETLVTKIDEIKPKFIPEKTETAIPAPTATTPVQLPAPVPSPAPPNVPEPGPEVSKIYLESGRTITGILKSEEGDLVKVEVGLQEGKGLLQIKKSQVISIETGNKPPRKPQ